MQLLGGLSGQKFLSQFWQKKPLLVRNAIPNFKGVVQAPELFALSLRDDIESRLVCRRRGGAWHMQHGPFSRTQIARLPKSGWTLLVQGLNLELPEADERGVDDLVAVRVVRIGKTNILDGHAHDAPREVRRIAATIEHAA